MNAAESFFGEALRSDRLRTQLTDVWAICEALELLDVADRSTFMRQSQGVIVRCPSPTHRDSTPSCSIRIAPDGLLAAKCHGCSFKGDVFSLVAVVLGLDTKRDRSHVLDAAELLRSELGTPTSCAKSSTPISIPAIDDADFDRIARLMDPIEKHVVVLEYTARRLPGVNLDGLLALPEQYSERAILIGRIVADVGTDVWMRSGLASESRNDFVFSSHRLMIPWRDLDGRIVSLQRRLIGDETPKYIFPRGRPARLPYGAECLASASPTTAIAFVEGALDTHALRAIVERQKLDWLVLGLPGTNGWRAEWASFAARRTAIIAVDRDDAGTTIAATMARELRSAGARRIERAIPTSGRDWAEAIGMGVQ